MAEYPAHNRPVVGSTPTTPTNTIKVLREPLSKDSGFFVDEEGASEKETQEAGNHKNRIV